MRDMLMWTAAGASVCAGAAALARSSYERSHFVTERTVIVSPKIRRPRTLLFLSDLHDNEFGPGNERLLAAARKEKPDGILIGGDMMVAKPGKAGLRVTERLLDGLAGMGCPVYYANGNHEQRLRRERNTYGTMYREFCRMLKTYGVHYLSDDTVTDGADLAVSGLDIDRRFYRDFVPAHMDPGYISRRLGEPDKTRFHILMAHSPLFFEAYAGWGADLSLAGHFHGGTIRIPGLGGVMTPQYQFFEPSCAGTFSRGDRRMIVSRGLGTHSINIRIFNRPQLVSVRLEGK
ncbi:MAG: metallophosphoesterase [Eubacteriales bacterium]|nr:metallophosphoesterase [Eubacteriales bacterium]